MSTNPIEVSSKKNVSLLAFIIILCYSGLPYLNINPMSSALQCVYLKRMTDLRATSHSSLMHFKEHCVARSYLCYEIGFIKADQ